MKNYPSKITIGICLFAIGFLLVFVKPKADASIPYPIGPDLANNVSLINEIDKEKIPQRIVIPDLGLDIDVVPSFIKNGYWEVFEDKAGWGVGSAYPGEIGNSVIFAHAKENLFEKLKFIKKDSKVFVLTKNGWFEYEAKNKFEVSPSDTKIVAPVNSEKKLTLYTCSGYKDTKRLVVVLSGR